MSILWFIYFGWNDFKGRLTYEESAGAAAGLMIFAILDCVILAIYLQFTK